MSILTEPIFYYVDPVDNTNFLIDFIEPNKANIEIGATLSVSSYTLEGLANEVSRTLNAYGQNTYTTSLDRVNRVLTISADDDFDLLVSSGSNSQTSIYPTIGFTGSDRTGSASYDSDAFGNIYEPQFPLQDYIGFGIYKEGISTKVNESSSGEVEVVTFGTKRLMTFNVKYITNKSGDRKAFTTDKPFDYVQDAVNFMEFITDKNKLEFMKDKTDRDTYDNILLEKTASSGNGSGYKLKELYTQKLLGFYETGSLRFRKL